MPSDRRLRPLASSRSSRPWRCLDPMRRVDSDLRCGNVRLHQTTPYPGGKRARCSSKPIRSAGHYPHLTWRNLRLFGTLALEVADHLSVAGRRREDVETCGGDRRHRRPAGAVCRTQEKGADREMLSDHRHLGSRARRLLDPSRA